MANFIQVRNQQLTQSNSSHKATTYTDEVQRTPEGWKATGEAELCKLKESKEILFSVDHKVQVQVWEDWAYGFLALFFPETEELIVGKHEVFSTDKRVLVLSPAYYGTSQCLFVALP